MNDAAAWRSRVGGSMRPPALNNLVNGKSGISPEMAIRLSKAFGGSAAVWLRMQMNYDLAQIEKTADKIKVRRITQPA
jgi:antitoxin HigA-1